MSETLVFDTPDKIAGFRLLTLRSGLKLELKGMKLSRGRSCFAIVKQEFGLKGNKQKVYDQFNKIVEERTGIVTSPA